MKQIAIIGAGIAGLTIAHELSTIAEVTLYEKSRGVSGRISTRYAGEFEFDHGAQFFTAKTKEFQEFLTPFQKDGTVQQWSPRLVDINQETGKTTTAEWTMPRYVAVPRMNSLCKDILTKLPVTIHLQTRVSKVVKDNNLWSVFIEGKTEAEYKKFDWVISTAPAPQSSVLFPEECCAALEYSSHIRMRGCYALMLGYKEDSMLLPWDAARVSHSPIEWISVNSSKPGRNASLALVIHSTHAWGEEMMDSDENKVIEQLLFALESIIPGAASPEYTSLHRWRYASFEHTQEERNTKNFYLDSRKGIGIAADWCFEPRVEAAFLSGFFLSSELKTLLRE